MALPNQPGDAFTHNNNYSALASKGGDNDQVNGRLDYSVSDKLRLFAPVFALALDEPAVRAIP